MEAIMEINNFENVRVGSGFPACFDVKPISDHESCGVYASIFTYKPKGEQGYFQLREHDSDKLVALFAFRFDNTALPKTWLDSRIIWDSRWDSEE